MPDHLEIYRTQAQQYDLLVTREDHQHHLFDALNRIIPLRGVSAVESGAGTGRLTCLLAPQVKEIIAFDSSQAMLDVAAAKLHDMGASNWRLAVSDHRRLPVPDGLADVALAGWSVCYLVEGPPEAWQTAVTDALRELRRVTRPGGHIILVETLGTGAELPSPPAKLVPYYEFLERQGFSRTWIRTDYLFRDRPEAEELVRFFFGDEMVARIVTDERGVTLPECTGLWSRGTPGPTA